MADAGAQIRISVNTEGKARLTEIEHLVNAGVILQVMKDGLSDENAARRFLGNAELAKQVVNTVRPFLMKEPSPDVVQQVKGYLPPDAYKKIIDETELRVINHARTCSAAPGSCPIGRACDVARDRLKMARAASGGTGPTPPKPSPPAAAQSSGYSNNPQSAEASVDNHISKYLTDLLHVHVLGREPCKKCADPHQCAKMRALYEHILSCPLPMTQTCPTMGNECPYAKQAWTHLKRHINRYKECATCMGVLSPFFQPDQVDSFARLLVSVDATKLTTPQDLLQVPAKSVLKPVQGSTVSHTAPVGMAVADAHVDAASTPATSQSLSGRQGVLHMNDGAKQQTVSLSTQRANYGPGFAHLAVLSAAGLDPLFESTGAALLHRPETVTLHPLPGQPKSNPLNSVALGEDLQTKDAAARAPSALLVNSRMVERSTQQARDLAEAEVRLFSAAETLLHAYAVAPKGRTKEPQKLFPRERNVYDELFRKVEESTAKFAQQFKDIPVDWMDVGVCGPSGFGLGHRVHQVASKQGVQLAGQMPMSKSDKDGVNAAPLLLGARYPDLRDILDDHEVASIAASVRADGIQNTQPIRPEDAAAAVLIGKPTERRQESNTLHFLRDLATAFALSLISGVLRHKGENQRATAIAAAHLAQQRDVRCQKPTFDPLPMSEVQPPVEIVESNDERIRGIWTKTLATWQAFYRSTKEELWKRALDVQRQHAELEAAANAGDKTARQKAGLLKVDYDRSKIPEPPRVDNQVPAGIADNYALHVEAICYRQCRTAFCNNLDNAAREYTNKRQQLSKKVDDMPVSGGVSAGPVDTTKAYVHTMASEGFQAFEDAEHIVLPTDTSLKDAIQPANEIFVDDIRNYLLSEMAIGNMYAADFDEKQSPDSMQADVDAVFGSVAKLSASAGSKRGRLSTDGDSTAPTPKRARKEEPPVAAAEPPKLQDLANAWQRLDALKSSAMPLGGHPRARSLCVWGANRGFVYKLREGHVKSRIVTLPQVD